MARLGLLNDSLRRGIFDGFKLAEIVREKVSVIDLEKLFMWSFREVIT
jgi:hypothetical protein